MIVNSGWVLSAKLIPSPNFSPRQQGILPTLVVVHSISLPPGVYGGDAIELFFTNRLDAETHPYFEGIKALRVSAHFLIKRSGEVIQFVSCDEAAWHAGTSSWQGRGRCNEFSIGVELEGLEGDTFEHVQYLRLNELILGLSAAYPIKDVTGHEHIAPGRKRDPGDGFDWSLVKKPNNL